KRKQRFSQRLSRTLVEQEVSNQSVLKPDPVSEVLADPGGSRLVGLLGLLLRVPQAHRDHLALCALHQPIGLEPRMGPEHTQHSLPTLVSGLLGCPAGQGVDTDADVAHRLPLPRSVNCPFSTEPEQPSRDGPGHDGTGDARPGYAATGDKATRRRAAAPWP